MTRFVALEHIVGLCIGCGFIMIGAVCLGYAARGITYAIAGFAGAVLVSGGVKALRMIMAEMDERRAA